MSTATAQASPNPALAMYSQGDTIYGGREAGRAHIGESSSTKESQKFTLYVLGEHWHSATDGDRFKDRGSNSERLMLLTAPVIYALKESLLNKTTKVIRKSEIHPATQVSIDS